MRRGGGVEPTMAGDGTSGERYEDINASAWRVAAGCSVSEHSYVHMTQLTCDPAQTNTNRRTETVTHCNTL